MRDFLIEQSETPDAKCSPGRRSRLCSPSMSTVLSMAWQPSRSDGLASATLTTQLEVEQTISALLTSQLSAPAPPALNKPQHLQFLTKILAAPLPAGYTGLDASRPWLLYWTLHSLALLDASLDATARARVVSTLVACQNEDGGFGGGPGQISHLAPSYAAVLALGYMGREGWDAIDRFVHFHFSRFRCDRAEELMRCRTGRGCIASCSR